MSGQTVPTVVGLDVGTTSAKAVAYDADGGVWGEGSHACVTTHPGAGRSEQDPSQVTDAAMSALRTAVLAATERGARVVAIAVCTAMHSLIGVDAAGRARTPMLTYADGRARMQARGLADGMGHELYRRTGTPVHPMSPLVKLRWFREEEPDTWARVHRWYSFKEYFLHQLLQDAWPVVVDQSVASATGLLSLAERAWDEAALDWAGVGLGQLSEPVATRHLLTGLPRQQAERLGLGAPVPLVVGAADGAAANLGVGAITPGVAALTIGTSGAVRTVVDRPRVDDRGRTFCYVLVADGGGPHRYVLGGATSNGGSVLQWLHEVVGSGDDLEEVLGAAAAVPPGAEGLLMLPYLHGERAPWWRQGLTGSVVGLRADHSRGHLVRAGLEGVALQLGLVLRAVSDLAGTSSAVRTTGGFTRSQLWTRIVADVLGVPLELSTRTEAAAFGVALLGMDALDLVESYAAATPPAGVERTVNPDPRTSDVYARLADAYAAVADHLLDEGFLDAVGRLRRSTAQADMA